MHACTFVYLFNLNSNNFSGIQIGGLSAMAPERKSDIAQVWFRSNFQEVRIWFYQFKPVPTVCKGPARSVQFSGNFKPLSYL
jgi:hypothetical protein